MYIAMRKSLVFTILLLLVLLKPNLVKAQVLSHFSFNTFTGGSAKIAGVSFPVTITALDQNDQILTTFQDNINLTDTTATIYPTQTTPFINGVWQGSVYITEVTNATVITASYQTVNDNSEAISVVADTKIKFALILSGNNQSGSVRTSLPSALTLKVVDPYNNPLNNIGVNFALTSTPPGSTNQSISNNTAITNSSGNASTTLTFGNKAGTYVVTGTLTTGITNTVTFYETATAAPLTSLSISPAVAVVPAGSYMPFSVNAFDQYGNLVPLTQTTWSVENGGGLIDQTGMFIAGTTLGTFMNSIRVLSGAIGSTATVTVVGAAGEAGGTATGSGLVTPNPNPTVTPFVYPGSLYNVSISPEVIAALRNASIPITAEATDFFGESISNVTYNFQIQGNLGTLTQTGPASAMLTVGESGMGSVTVTATQGDITRTARIVGSVGNGINRRLIIEEIASPQTVGVPFTVSIATKDPQNNFVTDYNGPLVLADSTGTIDPATVQPSNTGIWYVQTVVSLAQKDVSITAAGDGMVGVSNLFEVVGEPKKSAFKPGLNGLGEVMGASISGLIDLLMTKDLNKYAIFRYVGAGIAAGFGILGASIGGGIMASRGLEAIGRNPYAKTRLQVNLYASLIGFISAAAMAVLATFLILR